MSEDPKPALPPFPFAHPPIPPELEGWVYRDFPLMKEEYWCNLLDAMGDDNYKCLAFTSRMFEDGLFKRGQFFVSPDGIAGIARFAATLRSPNTKDQDYCEHCGADGNA